jgi:hypothetical protein
MAAGTQKDTAARRDGYLKFPFTSFMFLLSNSVNSLKNFPKPALQLDLHSRRVIVF